MVKDMIYDVPQLIEAVSQVMTLEEGDVILTGTPAGVGRIVAGDRIEAGLGLSNKGDLMTMVFDVVNRNKKTGTL
jgi:acylpyruvate hydrolase